MSLSSRLLDLVRSNLTGLTERASEFGAARRGPGLEDLSDDELEAELNRRRIRREAAERAAQSARAGGPSAERFRRTRGASRPGGGPHQDPALARLYAQLECPYGADLTSVRKHYRRLMRKYHPDLHTGSAEKQHLATELTQRLTSAYNELRRILSAR